MMLSGTVKRIHSDRGFGFITADDGRDFFFHRSGLDWSLAFEELRAGERVSFDIEPSAKGPRAGRVRAVSSR